MPVKNYNTIFKIIKSKDTQDLAIYTEYLALLNSRKQKKDSLLWQKPPDKLSLHTMNNL